MLHNKQYFSTLMLFEECKSVEDRLRGWLRNVRVGKFVQDVIFFLPHSAKSLALQLAISTCKYLRVKSKPVLLQISNFQNSSLITCDAQRV